VKLPILIEQMPFDVYLDDPAPEPSLTSSLVRRLLETAPRKVWRETRRLNPNAETATSSIFDLGTAAHALFTGEGNKIAEIPFNDYRTKDAQAARDAAYAAGKTPVLSKDIARVDAMACEALDQFSKNEDIGPLLPTSAREASIFWNEAGVMHRARPDFYHGPSNTIIHYKTTGVEIRPATLAKYAASSGWDMIAAHYDAAGFALTGSAPRQFFAVQETSPPHLCLVAELDEVFIGEARARRKRAIEIWARCLRTNTWPGNIGKTIMLECPEWHERNLIADKDAEQAAKANGADMMDLAIDWQAPEGWQSARKNEVIE
jgi:hypothetical protein